MIVEVKNLSLRYQSAEGEVEALRDVNLSLEEGEFVSLVGPSGCGKSTLLSAIAGLEKPTAGTVSVAGEAVTGPSLRVSFMPQKDQLFPWRSIWGNVTLGLEIRGMNDKAHQDSVRSLLEQYGLADFIRSHPAQLSGGMRQRCALIRTLATRPDILLLDEPFSAPDYQTRLAVSADIQSIIRQQGKTALLVTHDIAESVSLSDRIVVLTKRPGRVRSVYELSELQGLDPMERRGHSAFQRYFNSIWKELELDG